MSVFRGGGSILGGSGWRVYHAQGSAMASDEAGGFPAAGFGKAREGKTGILEIDQRPQFRPVTGSESEASAPKTGRSRSRAGQGSNDPHHSEPQPKTQVFQSLDQ
jgi:hypothetical protein